MLWLILLLSAAALALGLCWGAYRFAYCNPLPHVSDPYTLPRGEAYERHREQSLALIRQMDALPFEPVTILSQDGLRLYGRYYHVRDGAPLQIQMHGYRGDALRDFCGGHKLAREAGLNTLVVDQRAHGKSGGQTICFGVKERYDCLAWAEYAAGRWPGVPISLAGIYMGADTVLMASDLPLPDAVRCIIADCPFTSPRAIIRKVCWSLPRYFRVLYPFAALSAGLFGRFDLDGASALGAVSNTILLIHGEEDGFVPCSMSRQLREACAGPVRLEIFPHADHGMSYMEDEPRYRRLVLDFLRENGALPENGT